MIPRLEKEQGSKNVNVIVFFVGSIIMNSGSIIKNKQKKRCRIKIDVANRMGLSYFYF